VDFYIFKDDNNSSNPDLTYLRIENVEDIRYFCSKKGLYPIKLEHKDMIERIFHLLILDGYDLAGSNFIPLGFDYTCKNKKCSGIYNSLTSSSTLPINQFFQGAMEQSANPGFYVGFGLKAEPRMINFNITQVKISGLICSTNKFESRSDTVGVKTISCEMNTSQNTEIFNKNDVIVRCPKGCDRVSADVFGRGMYHGDSSICKAAIHVGILNGNGGKIMVVMQSTVDQYSGSHENGIRTSNKINDGIRPFIIMKYVPKCPIDKYKEKETKNNGQSKNFISAKTNKKASFLEIENSNEINKSAEKLIKELTENTQNSENSTYNNNNYVNNNYNSATVNNNENINNNNNKSSLEMEAFKQRFAEKKDKLPDLTSMTARAPSANSTYSAGGAFGYDGALGLGQIGIGGGSYGIGGYGGYGMGMGGYGGGYGGYAVGMGGQAGLDINNYNLGVGMAGNYIGYPNWDGYSKGMGLGYTGMGQSQVQGIEGSGMASVNLMGK
jgi:hypothetical protein